MYQKPDRLPLFPTTTTIEDDSLRIGGRDLTGLAERHGTPLYVYDGATMEEAADRYKAALRAHYPGPALVTYAAKAFLCTAIAHWAAQKDLQLDCAGESEMAVAAAGRVPASRIIMHGVNKSRADIEAALAQAGTIVVDNLSELRRIADLMHARKASERPLGTSTWLRLQPGIAVETHHRHTQTGQVDSKFGMTPAEMLDAAAFARTARIPVSGIHFHLGSNFRETTPLTHAIDLGLRLAKDMGMPETWHLSPGGGWGTAYNEAELPHPDIDTYVRVVARQVITKCRLYGLRLPVLHVEPGRSLVARAGVALYRVGTVKRRKTRTWLLIDGGMADNPRHALYAARYTCLPVRGLGREMSERVCIAGPYCESGDILIEDVLLPRIEEGELIAIPISGAYQLSMASNYNGARRPAAVWIEKGRARLILRRETNEDLTHRQLSIT